ncbi:uncharacterized protein LOC124317384 [Daphnia pulicaria]|uniref:uncharacterized protein LOC124317351 n=1 Tax=Daphnia pulicaria TaxID=35523 RepID=UPI001EEC08B8|nr:uncharacterized protein LOC124317351 [Daphnia pulicaria]XP_046638717.1 uncharacterized protein LOC124317367 [Daphnia pulicaria]XP_046638718.1 uncharacterized protein LOC124317384 [Daphnia pulicaria]
MHWGQLVAHDITHVPTFRTLTNSAIQCCTGDGKYLSPERTLFPHRTHFVSPSMWTTTMNSRVNLALAVTISSALSSLLEKIANSVMPTSSTEFRPIWTLPSFMARLLLKKLSCYPNRQSAGTMFVLPVDPERKDCISDEYGSQCFVAGDQRVNQYTGPTVSCTSSFGFVCTTSMLTSWL